MIHAPKDPAGNFAIPPSWAADEERRAAERHAAQPRARKLPLVLPPPRNSDLHREPPSQWAVAEMQGDLERVSQPMRVDDGPPRARGPVEDLPDETLLAATTSAAHGAGMDEAGMIDVDGRLMPLAVARRVERSGPNQLNSGPGARAIAAAVRAYDFVKEQAATFARDRAMPAPALSQRDGLLTAALAGSAKEQEADQRRQTLPDDADAAGELEAAQAAVVAAEKEIEAVRERLTEAHSRVQRSQESLAASRHQLEDIERQRTEARAIIRAEVERAAERGEAPPAPSVDLPAIDARAHTVGAAISAVPLIIADHQAAERAIATQLQDAQGELSVARARVAYARVLIESKAAIRAVQALGALLAEAEHTARAASTVDVRSAEEKRRAGNTVVNVPVRAPVVRSASRLREQFASALRDAMRGK